MVLVTCVLNCINIGDLIASPAKLMLQFRDGHYEGRGEAPTESNGELISGRFQTTLLFHRV